MTRQEAEGPIESAGDGAARLAPCPDSPNCVCSQDERAERRVQPFSDLGPTAEAMARLRRVLESLPRCRIVDSTDRYLRAEFTSRVFRYVDDLEVLIDDATGLAHVRSASRVGHWDLGVNRRRVEAIRRRLDRLTRKG